MTANEARKFTEMNQAEIKKIDQAETARLFTLHGPKMLALAHMLIDVAVGFGLNRVALPNFGLNVNVMDMISIELSGKGYQLVRSIENDAYCYEIRWNVCSS